MNLQAFFDSVYVIEKEISGPTVDQYRIAIRKYESWHRDALDSEPTIESIREDCLNRWIIHLKEKEGLSPYTLKSKRDAIRAMLNLAYELRFIAHRIDRWRRIKLPETPKDVWTHDEINHLIETCRTADVQFLRGRMPMNRIKRRDYAQMLFAVAFDTGLRRHDLTRIRLEWVTQTSRTWSMVQHKTMRQTVCRIHANTQDLIVNSLDAHCRDRELLFPLWYDAKSKQSSALRALSRFAGKCMRLAGLNTSDGALQKIRRSSGTYIELFHSGKAYMHLGHSSPETSRKFYVNAALATSDIPMPPALELKA